MFRRIFQVQTRHGASLQLLDLCSGVGAGFPYTAIALSGFSLVGLCERNEWCQDILRLRYPNCHIERDINTLNYDRYKGRIDIITASPPLSTLLHPGKTVGGSRRKRLFPGTHPSDRPNPAPILLH